MSEKNNSYRQILKSTGIFGGSQVITTIIGFLRNKLIAVLLGAGGLGLISMYQSVIDTIKSISSFGIETGGVREVASNSNDSVEIQKQAETVAVIDKLTFTFACISALFCIAFSYPISLWVFDDHTHVLQIILLSVSLFFSMLATGQTVVLQGYRQIGYMVKSAIIWNSFGLVVAVPLYYYLRVEGIIPVFVVVSIAMYLSARFYRDKLRIPKAEVSYRTAFVKGYSLFRLGVFVVLSSILSTFSFLLIRAFINRNMGEEWVGIYQAIWTITNVSLALVLRSMGSDFYPRLCAVNDDATQVKRLVNEQSYVVLVISAPLIIGLFLGASIILQILYSSDFLVGIPIFNWQILGTFIKVISWPLGFILLAKGRGGLFLISEIIYFAVYVGAIYLLYPIMGSQILGVAYLLAYIVYLPVVFYLGKYISDFGFEKYVLKVGSVCCALIVAVFCLYLFQPHLLLWVGIPLLLFSASYSIIKINKVVPLKSVAEIMLNKLKKN